jgi:hypothetical protein
MAESLKLIFADCFACGMRKTWAEHQLAEAQANELNIEKVPFYADGAAEYIRLAIKQGVNMPFFSDGKKCSKNVADFIEVEAPKKKTVKRRVKKVEAKDES